LRTPRELGLIISTRCCGVTEPPHKVPREKPLSALYTGTDALIPVEIGKPSLRVMYTPPNNQEILREELDLVDKVRKLARLTEMSRKQRVAQRYNAKVVKYEFVLNDLILRRASIGLKNAKDGKLAANLEGVRST
jgi:hypothetical protein